MSDNTSRCAADLGMRQHCTGGCRSHLGARDLVEHNLPTQIRRPFLWDTGKNDGKDRETEETGDDCKPCCLESRACACVSACLALVCRVQQGEQKTRERRQKRSRDAYLGRFRLPRMFSGEGCRMRGYRCGLPCPFQRTCLPFLGGSPPATRSLQPTGFLQICSQCGSTYQQPPQSACNARPPTCQHRNPRWPIWQHWDAQLGGQRGDARAERVQGTRDAPQPRP